MEEARLERVEECMQVNTTFERLVSGGDSREKLSQRGMWGLEVGVLFVVLR